MSVVGFMSLRIGTAAALAGASLLAAPAMAQVVGNASAVNPASTGGGGRTLTIGASIIHNERVRTDAKGSVQIMFIDKTNLSVGPNSDIVINNYVFDPEAKKGKMAVSVAKGVLRFVGGKISHDGDATVNTPTATIGVRGYTGVFSVIGGSTQITTVTGVATATAFATGQTTSVPTGFSLVTSGGASAPTVAPTTQAQATAATQAMSSAGQTGGASASTSGAALTQSNVSSLTNPPTGSSGQTAPVSGSNPTNNAATGGATGTNSDSILITTATVSVQQSAGGSAAVTTAQQVLAERAAAAEAAARAAAAAAAAALADAARQDALRRSFTAAPFALTITRCCDPNNQSSAVPFLPADFAPPGGTTVFSPVLGYRIAANPSNPDNAGRGVILQYGFNINGAGASQSSFFYVASGNFLDTGDGGLVAQGGFAGSRRSAANVNPNSAGGPFSSPAGAVSVDADRLPVSTNINGIFYNTSTGEYQPNDPNINPSYGQRQADGSVVTVDYNFTQALARRSTPEELGNYRPAFTTSNGNPLQGYVGGIMRTVTINNPTNVGAAFVIGNVNNTPSDVAVQLDPSTGRVQANFNINRQSASTTSFNSAQFQFGSVNTALQARGSYIDYNNFGARDARLVTNAQTGDTSQISTVNGGALIGGVGAMVAVTPQDGQTLLNALGSAAPTVCNCEYTRWGFWFMRPDRTSGGTDVRDTSNMMLWVAGQLPTAAEVPTSGVATYSGHMVANVQNSGNQYIAGANFTNVVNFGARTGTVNVGGANVGPGLDGANFSGTVQLGADPRNFSGTLPGSLGRTMTMTGSFFRGAAGPVGEIGGKVSVTGSGGYLASGIFVGKP